MSLFNQMKSVKDKVKYLLTQTPHLRDDDYKLIATFWWHELGKDDTNLMSGYDLLKRFANAKMTHPESIRRVRAKLQEQYPDLRGESYNRRQDEGEDTNTDIHGL